MTSEKVYDAMKEVTTLVSEMQMLSPLLLSPPTTWRRYAIRTVRKGPLLHRPQSAIMAT